MRIARRTFLTGAALTLSPLARLSASAASPADFTALEQETGGRIGVYARNLRTGQALAWRADERFLMCSTFKALAVGMLLSRVDASRERLDRLVPYGSKDLLGNSPVTAAAVGKGGLPLATLCQAALQVSDNGAANLILRSLGGPKALTAWLRSIGDSVTHLDRMEGALNRAAGDLDTTTPRAMAESLRRLLLGDVLSPASRARLTVWMEGCKTGLERLRAGVPAGWRVADKTGTGYDGAAGDNAVIWPDRRTAIVVSAYTLGGKATASNLDATFAEIGRIIAGRLAA